MTQHWWKCWSAEYLQQLQQLHKWKTPQRNLSIGDIVLIKEDNPFTTHWPLAKVISTFPGQDGKVCVVQVKTATSTYKRPTSKIVLILPQQLGKDQSSFG